VRLNDGAGEAQCATNFYCWVYAGTSAGTGWFQYTWSSPQTIGRLAIDTGSTCGSSGRNLAGATIQYWSGSAWVTAGTVSGQTGDWSFTFPTPVSTTQIRLYGAYAQSTANPLIYEWQVFGC
jgi:hypothetical protein